MAIELKGAPESVTAPILAALRGAPLASVALIMPGNLSPTNGAPQGVQISGLLADNNGAPCGFPVLYPVGGNRRLRPSGPMTA